MKNLCPDDKSPEMPGPVFSEKAEITGFFKYILDSGLSLRVRVTGRSMVPFLKGGEVVTMKKVPQSELRRGDLIFVRSRPGSPVLHRLVRRRRTGKGDIVFQTRGDALRAFDAPVMQDEILGKVCKVERFCCESGIEQINMNSWLQRKINYLRALIGLFQTHCYYGLQRIFKPKNPCRGNPQSRRMAFAVSSHVKLGLMEDPKEKAFMRGAKE